MAMQPGECFGFYTGEWRCTNGCRLVQQCKAVVNSDGLDVVSDVLEQLLDDMPEGGYLSSGFHRVVLKQILNPAEVVSSSHRLDAEAQILQALDLEDERVPF